MSHARSFEELTMTEAQREAFLERVRTTVNPEDYRMIEGMSHALPEIIKLIEQEPMTMGKLRHLLFGPKTEKTQRVCSPATPPPPPQAPQAPKPKRKGHVHGLTGMVTCRVTTRGAHGS